MKVEILHATTKDVLHSINDVSIYTTIEEIKAMYAQTKHIDASRQAFRKEPRGKFLDDSVTLRSLDFDSTAKLYFKDLGPQVMVVNLLYETFYYIIWKTRTRTKEMTTESSSVDYFIYLKGVKKSFIAP